jgi:hypothetical protein
MCCMAEYKSQGGVCVSRLLLERGVDVSAQRKDSSLPEARDRSAASQPQ